MPNSKRQNFIVKIRQSINLYYKIGIYLRKIRIYCFNSDFAQDVNEIIDNNNNNIAKLREFLIKVRGW